MIKKLKAEEIEAQLKSLNDWSLYNGTYIHKHFVFIDFKQAFEFMKKCARYAEAINHHPEWTNVYNIVDVKLSTHDVDGLTNLDFDLAAYMDKEFKI